MAWQRTCPERSAGHPVRASLRCDDSVPLCTIASVRSVHSTCRRALSCEELFEIFMTRLASGQDVLSALRSVCGILSSSPGQRLSFLYLSLSEALVHGPSRASLSRRRTSEQLFCGGTRWCAGSSTLLFVPSVAADVTLTLFFMHDDFHWRASGAMQTHGYAG